MPPLTVSEKISIAKISQYIAGNEIEKAGYYGGGEDLRLERKLYVVRKNVEYVYNLDPTNETLVSTSNYMYALCGKWGLAAQNKINGGGSVAPVTPRPIPEPYDWEVGEETSSLAPLAAGDSSVTLESFIGFNIEFTRGNLTQNTTSLDDGTSYYSWNRVTGLFTISPAASLGELMRILPASVLSRGDLAETQTEFTEGLLVIGNTYEITDYNGGDIFDNVANVISGIINTDGCIFECIGTTPTNWTNSSLLTLQT